MTGACYNEKIATLQALEEWDPATFERCLEPMEDALTAAAEDALSETRTAGRAALAAYARVRPDRAHALLPRLQPGLRAKLREALAAPVPGAHAQHPSTHPLPLPYHSTHCMCHS